MAARKARNIFRKLVGKVLSGKASSDEEKFADAYYRHFSREEGYLHNLSQEEKDKLGRQLFSRIRQGIRPVSSRPVISMSYLKASIAAAVMLILFSTLYYHRSGTGRIVTDTANDSINTAESLKPGANKAILTLSDGKKIMLDSSGSGLLAQQGKVAIVQQTPGALAYHPGSGDTTAIALNTVQTPRGGQFSVMLSDGSRVWLNAASQLKFPVRFTGNDRMVELNGEAYFEVAQMAGKPFKVKTAQEEVEVLGTHFNVMAYHDEPFVQTTLLQGKVQVRTNAQTRVLEPGQQAVVSTQGSQHMTVQTVNTDHFVAWKNGSFSFDNTDIYTMMRQISRWYDVEVHFKDSLNLRFNGSLKKNVDAATLFKMLTMTGEVKYSIANGVLTIEKR